MSGYSRWSKAPLSSRQIEKENLKERIREIFAKHNGMVGSPMVTADIHDDPAFSKVSRPRVARLMREMGLKCGTVKKIVVTTDSQHNEPVAPDQIWVSDMTYLKVGSRWYYLTVFLDLFSRFAVGWDLSASLERHSAIRALKSRFCGAFLAVG